VAERLQKWLANRGLASRRELEAWISAGRPHVERVPDSDPPTTLDYDMWVGPAPMRPYNENRGHYWWHFVPEYGTGEMGNWGAHWLDIAQWVLDLGYPESVMGAGGTYVMRDAKEMPDTQTVIYQYPERTLLWEQRLWTSSDVNRERSGIEFTGSKGTLVLSRNGWTVHPRDGRAQRNRGTELMLTHVTNFAASIRGEATPAASMEDGHLTAALCHLGNIVANGNRRVVYDPNAQTCVDDAEASAMLRRDYREPWASAVQRTA